MRRTSRDRTLIRAYGCLLGASALDAFSVGPIPVQWVMQVTVALSGFWLALHYKDARFPGFRSAWVLVAWVTAITIINAGTQRFDLIMPSGSSSPYPLFIGLRIAALASVVCGIHLVYFLIRQGHRDAVIRTTLNVAFVVACYALYVYVARVLGLPDFPKSRLGTDGLSQTGEFTYAFRRASGSFREPAFLAAWLVTPFALSLGQHGDRRAPVQSIIIGAALLLTGSLSGIVALGAGLLLALPLLWRTGGRPVKRAVRMGILLIMSLSLFNWLVVPEEDGSASIFSVISGRLAPVLSNGAGSSNRGYIYDYVTSHPPSVLGIGLGHSNIVFANEVRSYLITSFNSVYVNIAYSSGLLGLILLGYFLLKPVGRVIRKPVGSRPRSLYYVAAAFLAWLFLLGTMSEEFPFIFSVTFALLAFEGSATRRTASKAEKLDDQGHRRERVQPL